MSVVIKKGSSKQSIKRKIKNTSGNKFPAHKFVGKLKVKQDAVEIQRKLRDEWE